MSLALISKILFQGTFLETLYYFFAILVAVEIFGFVIYEVKEGVKEKGVKGEIIDTVIAVAIAAIFWFGLGFILNTPTPISAVASCSMKPNLDRGDFIIIQGTTLNLPIWQITKKEFEQLNNFTINYKNKTIRGSLYSYCLANDDEICSDLLEGKAIEKRGPFEFKYELCEIEIDGTKSDYPCITEISYKDKKIKIPQETDTIVYKPTIGTLFSYVGDIVHRGIVLIDVEGKQYVLAKGDNNPVFDIQLYHYGINKGNTLPSKEQLNGKVLARIPYLGNIKLFIEGRLVEDAQCKTQLIYND